MLGVISHEAHKSFSNAAQALECIFSWRGVLRALRFMFLGILCWRFCSPTTDNAILFYLGEIATKKRNKVELSIRSKRKAGFKSVYLT
jgi:hypothetical protein